MYLLNDGTKVTAQQIKDAFNNGNAVLIHGRGNGKTTTGLMLDGNHFDTRGQCYSMWGEVWTRPPQKIQDALSAAYVH